jgi:hypothetical protein
MKTESWMKVLQIYRLFQRILSLLLVPHWVLCLDDGILEDLPVLLLCAIMGCCRVLGLFGERCWPGCNGVDMLMVGMGLSLRPICEYIPIEEPALS